MLLFVLNLTKVRKLSTWCGSAGCCCKYGTEQYLGDKRIKKEAFAFLGWGLNSEVQAGNANGIRYVPTYLILKKKGLTTASELTAPSALLS